MQFAQWIVYEDLLGFPSVASYVQKNRGFTVSVPHIRFQFMWTKLLVCAVYACSFDEHVLLNSFWHWSNEFTSVSHEAYPHCSARDVEFLCHSYSYRSVWCHKRELHLFDSGHISGNRASCLVDKQKVAKKVISQRCFHGL